MIDTDERALAVLDEAIRICDRATDWMDELKGARDYLRRRLAQPDQSEPVAEVYALPTGEHRVELGKPYRDLPIGTKLYTHPDRTQAPGEVANAVRFLAGVRVFLATRERIKQPEGLEMFDEAIEVLRKTHEVDHE